MKINVIKLPKLNWVKCRSSIQHIENDRIKSVTVKRKSSGQYEISLLVESENQTLHKTITDQRICFSY